ncbi:MAG: translocation/assembly module TamB domain-containing protein [Pseudomonadota bacterium]
MRRFLLISTLVIATAGPLPAQDDDPSYIEGLIQDALSGTSREVRVTGFSGALSSNATMERLTIADEDGVWLSLEDASLVWSRAALLRGRLEVDELTAGRIELTRIPESSPPPPTPEDAEAQPFALPELPVSIELDELRADQVILGEAILGEAATLSVTGSMSLIDGAADVDIAVQRTDQDDRLTLVAGYANATQDLKIDLDFEEAAGGLISRAANIPGAPALGLTVTGQAPLADFEAIIALSSDGVDRLGGTVGISAAEDENDATGVYRFAANLDGDLRPLMAAELHEFFGDNVALQLDGSTGPDGVVLDRLDVSTGALSLAGDLALAPGGLPTRFAFDGRIAGDGPVRLPSISPAIMVDNVTLTARFDASDDDAWSANITVNELTRDELAVSQAVIEGAGQISSGATPAISANVTFRTNGFDHADPGLASAVGPSPEGLINLTWSQGAPFDVPRLVISSGNASLQARGQVDGLADGFAVDGAGVLSADDLSRFAGISGRPLAGRAVVDFEGEGTPLSGAFDVTLTASTEDLRTGEARIDPLLRGTSALDLAARRDETGAYIEALTLRNDAIDADISGQLSGDAGAIALSGSLSDLSLVEPKLSGPAQIDTNVTWQSDGALDVKNLTLAALDADIAAIGTINTGDESLPAEGTFALKAKDIARLAELLGRPLAGTVDLDITGRGSLRDASVDGRVALLASGLRTGIVQVDRITGGEVDLDADLAYGNGVPFLDMLSLVTQNLTASANAPARDAPITVDARLANLGRVAPGINGPAALSGTLSPRDARGEAVDVDLKFDGPSGVGATIIGQVRDLGQQLDLAIRGNAPLALANSFISPNAITGPLSFDLRLAGPPGLSALSGQASFRDARVSVPTANIAVTGLGGSLNLSGGQVSPDITGSLGNGGQFRVTGPVTLSAPFNANLNVALSALGLRDPSLYETSVNGTVNFTGPLTRGARIGGAIALGRTELRVPSGGATAVGAPDGIRHIGEPSDVRRTRARAGLIETRRSGPTRGFPLDLTISAPSQIFVRGRGLDAELGGSLRLGGTTTNVAASGVFELIRGRIDVLTKRLDLTEGLIDLRGALDPYLRFVAQTTSNEYTINIVLEGLASEPAISFTSSPDLPQEQVLAQLLFGRDFSEMSALQAAQLVSAVATLSGKGSGGLQGRLRDQLGLADFDVTTTDDGATQFSAGAYISDNIYSEIVADSEGNDEINLNIDLSPSLTVKGSAGNDGNTGLGIFFERDY